MTAEKTTTKSFLIMSDTHFKVSGTGNNMIWWNEMLKTDLEDISYAIIDTVKKLNPDFIIHCGDVTDDGEIASFRQAKSIMDTMQCPYYITLGNHDTFCPNARTAIAKMFHSHPIKS